LLPKSIATKANIVAIEIALLSSTSLFDLYATTCDSCGGFVNGRLQGCCIGDLVVSPVSFWVATQMGHHKNETKSTEGIEKMIGISRLLSLHRYPILAAFHPDWGSF
jgi:hypothetical protein